MREIKFRAWDKENKKFIDDFDIAINLNGELFGRHEHQLELNPMSRTKSATFELMQYTGLKDKNGTDIYEGDIIKYQEITFGESEPNQSVVVWKEYSFKPFDLAIENIEIIGNVLENPELLST